MRVFFDTEFVEDGRTIDLISIGLVRDDDAELYLVAGDFNEKCAHADLWIRNNVLAHIPKDFAREPRANMKYLIEDFLFGEKPEFWAYYADYDWVAFCQLWGRMLDLPKGWPKYCRDLKQLADENNFILPSQKGVEHHALADARWVKEAFDYCQQRKVVIQ